MFLKNIFHEHIRFIFYIISCIVSCIFIFFTSFFFDERSRRRNDICNTSIKFKLNVFFIISKSKHFRWLNRLNICFCLFIDFRERYLSRITDDSFIRSKSSLKRDRSLKWNSKKKIETKVQLFDLQKIRKKKSRRKFNSLICRIMNRKLNKKSMCVYIFQLYEFICFLLVHSLCELLSSHILEISHAR